MAETLIPSDYAELQTVLVQPPSDESRHVHLFAPSINLPGFTSDIIGRRAASQHENFQNVLRQEGVEVLNTHTLIDSAIKKAAEVNELRQFIEKSFPRLASRSDDALKRLTAQDLIGATAIQYPEEIGKEPFKAHALQWMYFTRDFAVTFPQGVAIASFDNENRRPEADLARFMFTYAPELQDYPVVFDAEKEGVLMQGGDMIILNDHTLLMGVDNLSSRDAAKKLAQKLSIDVVAVAMPKGPAVPEGKYRDTPLNSLFLHLDTILNVIDDKKALALPYFLQDEFATNSPFEALLQSIEKENLSDAERQSLDTVRKALRDFGKVTLYEADTGDEVPTGKRIVNYLQDEYGYQFAFAGGAPKDTLQDQVAHVVEHVMPEIRFQASNVVAVKPGKVLMYQDDTEETQKELQKLGVEVVLFDAHELVRWNGGPHCMTMPLRRGN